MAVTRFPGNHADRGRVSSRGRRSDRSLDPENLGSCKSWILNLGLAEQPAGGRVESKVLSARYNCAGRPKSSDPRTGITGSRLQAGHFTERGDDRIEGLFRFRRTRHDFENVCCRVAMIDVVIVSAISASLGVEHAHDQRLRHQSAPAHHLGHDLAQPRVRGLVTHERPACGLCCQSALAIFAVERLEPAFIQRLL